MPQKRRDRSELEPLAHNGRGHEEARGDFFFPRALLAQGLEGLELIQRMEVGAVHVLGEGILLGGGGGVSIAHNTGNESGLRQTLLLDQQLKGLESAPAGRDFVLTFIAALSTRDGAHAEALQ